MIDSNDYSVCSFDEFASTSITHQCWHLARSSHIGSIIWREWSILYVQINNTFWSTHRIHTHTHIEGAIFDELRQPFSPFHLIPYRNFSFDLFGYACTNIHSIAKGIEQILCLPPTPSNSTVVYIIIVLIAHIIYMSILTIVNLFSTFFILPPQSSLDIFFFCIDCFRWWWCYSVRVYIALLLCSHRAIARMI